MTDTWLDANVKTLIGKTLTVHTKDGKVIPGKVLDANVNVIELKHTQGIYQIRTSAITAFFFSDLDKEINK